MRYLKSIMLLTICFFAFISCDSGGHEVDTPSVEATAGDTDMMEQAKNMQEFTITEDNVMMENKTIVQIVEQSEQFSILQQALTSANMLNMLDSGSYTVIAPTNDAFEELDEGTLEKWLMTENRDLLSRVLQYHAIKGEIAAKDLKDGFVYASVLGSPLNFDVEPDGEININDHEVEYVIHAENGVVYVMAEVLMPEDINDDLADLY